MPQLVTIALLPPQEDGVQNKQGKQYATIRLSDSYEATVDSAIKAHKRYLPATIGIEDIEVLWPIADGDDRAWSTIQAEDWSLIKVERMLAIRMKVDYPTHGSDNDLNRYQNSFVIGKVGLSYGVFKNFSTQWSRVSFLHENIISPGIDRPRSYQEAVGFIKAFVANEKYCPFEGLKSNGKSKLSEKDNDNCDFKFYFVNLSGPPNLSEQWVEFPESAYTDEKVWRSLVPRPSKVLGFSLLERRAPPYKAST